MAKYRIRGLAKLISAMITLCKIIDTFAPGVRLFVPDGDKAGFDTALASVKTACDALRAINYQDTSDGTSAPWGQE